MDLSRLKILVEKQASKTISNDEKSELFGLLYSKENEPEIKLLIEQVYKSTGEEIQMREQAANEIVKWILKTGKKPASIVRLHNRTLYRIAAAAIILFLAIGAYFIKSKSDDVKQVAKLEMKTDVAPGQEGAVLTLADGSKIILDSTQHGLIAQQGSSKVVEGEKGISYQTNSIEQKVVYNTMSTPKGRQYSLVLSDGSKVWLNAGSSIRFPSAFIGKERSVQITGEVYKKKKKNASMPFRVTVNDMTVQVLGTHFDINSYADENYIKTTLLEGKVQVLRNGSIVELKPGQQARINRTGNQPINLVNDADLDEVMAWKNGLFHFNSSSLQEVMKQIVRWYDVDVVYQGKIPERKFDGEISRGSNLSQVLKILEETKIHYTIEDRKLIVHP